jgi:glutathione S-transferase
MNIHGDVISPFTRMCLVTAHEVGLKDRVKLVPAVVRPSEVNTTLTKLSPIGKIPVLETDHGHSIYDSRVIMEYLAHVAGEKGFIPDDGVKRFRVLTLQSLAQSTADAAVALRYEIVQRPEAMRWPEYRSRLKTRVIESLEHIEAEWMADLKGVNVASVAVACTLGYIDFRHDALNWRNTCPNLDEFAQRFNKRMSMEAWPLT